MALGGFKDFTAEAATSGDVDSYLMQGILVFASTAARDSALASYLEEGRFCYTSDDNSVWYYDGSAWIPYSTQWTSYTPSWTNLTPNSATVTAEYRYLQGDLRVTGKITIAADTGFAGGTIYQTLPDGATSTGIWKGGTGLLNDDSASLFEAAVIGITPSSTTFAWVAGKTGGLVTDVSPWTWTTDDQITWDFVTAVA